MAPVLIAIQLPVLDWFVRIQAYPLAHLLALVSLVGLTLWLYRRETGAAGPALDLLLVAVPAGLLGSVLLGALTSGVVPPLRLRSLWSGYRSAYGGLLAGIGAAWLFARMGRVPLAIFLDCATPGLAVGVWWCRLGCFLAGCCWGRPTKSSLGLEFPFDHPGMLSLPRGQEWTLLPTQLYLAATALVILFVTVAFQHRLRDRPGSLFAVAALLYALSTFLIEFLRADPGRRFVAHLSHNQWISLAVLAAACLSLLAARQRGKAGAAPPEVDGAGV
jgi:phosphatidylglycerol:prolipoprotein diacylglycerol transferase